MLINITFGVFGVMFSELAHHNYFVFALSNTRYSLWKTLLH